MEATFNLRECAKQMILLEDHIFHRRKRCEDCIRKHFLTAEALAEEGAGLNGTVSLRDQCDTLADKIRELQQLYVLSEGEDTKMVDLGNKLRTIRKGLVSKTFDMPLQDSYQCKGKVEDSMKDDAKEGFVGGPGSIKQTSYAQWKRMQQNNPNIPFKVHHKRKPTHYGAHEHLISQKFDISLGDIWASPSPFF
jgi:hypothetical protein